MWPPISFDICCPSASCTPHDSRIKAAPSHSKPLNFILYSPCPSPSRETAPQTFFLGSTSSSLPGSSPQFVTHSRQWQRIPSAPPCSSTSFSRLATFFNPRPSKSSTAALSDDPSPPNHLPTSFPQPCISPHQCPSDEALSGNRLAGDNFPTGFAEKAQRQALSLPCSFFTMHSFFPTTAHQTVHVKSTLKLVREGWGSLKTRIWRERWRSSLERGLWRVSQSRFDDWALQVGGLKRQPSFLIRFSRGSPAATGAELEAPSQRLLSHREFRYIYNIERYV